MVISSASKASLKRTPDKQQILALLHSLIVSDWRLPLGQQRLKTEQVMDPHTDNCDVAHEGAVDIAEALVVAQASGAHPGQSAGVIVWGHACYSRGEGLC